MTSVRNSEDGLIMSISCSKIVSETVDELPKISASFDAWVGGRNVENLGSNAESRLLAFQSWRNFKEAFAPEIVAQAAADMDGPIHRILDPFAGSGTTALASQFLGAQPIAIEVNPYLADLISAKLSEYDPDELIQTVRQVVDRSLKGQPETVPFQGAPQTFVEPGVEGRYIFSRSIAERIAAYNKVINDLENEKLKRLFRVLLSSVLIPASNVTVSGKGRRYRSGWKKRPKDPKIVDELFEIAVRRAIRDISRFRDRACRDYELYCGDARTLVSQVGTFDLVVTSPPYPNSFDYTDVYNVELWALGYLTSRDQNTALRRATLRSHVQIKRDMSTTFDAPALLLKSVGALQNARQYLWNPCIPDMIAAYFQDMHDILQALYTNLRLGGRIYLVVGDSQYADVQVPVAGIISEVGKLLNYRILKLERFRSMRVAPQQGGRKQLSETLLILEKTA